MRRRLPLNIKRAMSFGLSGGTTNYLMAKLLKPARGITVVTNAVNMAMELAGSDIQVVVTGGMMRHNSFELCGPLGEGMVGQLNIGKMFIGVDGVSSTGGITTYSEQEAQIAKAMIRRSKRRTPYSITRRLAELLYSPLRRYLSCRV